MKKTATFLTLPLLLLLIFGFTMKINNQKTVFETVADDYPRVEYIGSPGNDYWLHHYTQQDYDLMIGQPPLTLIWNRMTGIFCFCLTCTSVCDCASPIIITPYY